MFKIVVTSEDSGNRYTMGVDPFGSLTCTCKDFEYRSGPEGRLCKHLQKFVGTYEVVEETQAQVLATMVQNLTVASYTAPTRVRTGINTVVGYLGRELANEVLQGDK